MTLGGSDTVWTLGPGKHATNLRPHVWIHVFHNLWLTESQLTRQLPWLTWGVSESLFCSRPRRQLVSPQGFPLNADWHYPPLPPNLPISPWARYRESDDDVLEQLLQERRRQETGTKVPANTLAKIQKCGQIHTLKHMNYMFGKPGLANGKIVVK